MPKAPHAQKQASSSSSGIWQQQLGAAVAAPRRAPPKPRTLQLSRSEPTLNRQNSTTSLTSLPEEHILATFPEGIETRAIVQHSWWSESEGEGDDDAPHADASFTRAARTSAGSAVADPGAFTQSETEVETDWEDQEANATGFGHFSERKDVGNAGV